MASLKHELRARRKYLLLLAVLALTLYGVIPQLGEFKASWHLLRHPLLSWVGAALGLSALTYFSAAATYCLLAFHALAYARTVVVQLAATFINRLLPGGVGALGTNFAYLRRQRHTAAQAATAVAVNNGLGVCGHILLLIAAFIITPGRNPASLERALHHAHWLAGLLVALTVVVILALSGHRFRRPLKVFMKQLVSYRRRLWRLAAALLSSMSLTLSNVLCLSCCCLAFGVHESFLALLVIFSFGIGTGTVSPTPGGLGGFEAGLTVGFIAADIGSATALAIALLYRLLTYWLPLVIGLPAVIVVQQRKFLDI